MAQDIFDLLALTFSLSQ